MTGSLTRQDDHQAACKYSPPRPTTVSWPGIGGEALDLRSKLRSTIALVRPEMRVMLFCTFSFHFPSPQFSVYRLPPLSSLLFCISFLLSSFTFNLFPFTFSLVDLYIFILKLFSLALSCFLLLVLILFVRSLHPILPLLCLNFFFYIIFSFYFTSSSSSSSSSRVDIMYCKF